MRFVRSDNMGEPCPYNCGASLEVEASWECDGEPYPDQDLRCPNCDGLIHVSQRVVTELEKTQ